MSNFFYKYSDYSLFQKALKETEGEDVIVDILSTDDSLKKDEVIADKRVIRKDNRFSQESSFNKFFGPRKNFSRNFDMKDFSSWKNKNYRETEKQLNSSGGDKFKFSFSDFLNERSGEKIYNDADDNKSKNQKAINELSTDDSSFKRFSLNDYMRRLEEKTRVNSETSKNEDLIDSIGDITQNVVPDASQDENFNDFGSGMSFDKIVDSSDTVGDRYAVDRSELDAMKQRLAEIKSETDEINSMIEDDEDEGFPTFNFEPNEDEDFSEDNELSEDFDEESAESEEESVDEISEDNENVDDTDGELDENIDENVDESSNEDDADSTETFVQPGQTEIVVKIEGGTNSNETNTSVDGKIETDKVGEGVTTSISQVGQSSTGSGSQSDSSGGRGQTSLTGDSNQSGSSEVGGQAGITEGQSGTIKIGDQDGQKGEISGEEANQVGLKQEERSKEIIGLIEKNEQEKKEIEEQLKQAEKEKVSAMKSYEGRLKELEKSIIEKDKEVQKKVLLEKIKNDNKLTEVRAEFKTREDEIRRLEKEAALKMKIGALLKKELKNNLSISNLEMNNKLLEISSLISQEKEREKANKRKRPATGPRKKKRKIDSDIIGGIDFE